jgi:hypothetical protein
MSSSVGRCKAEDLSDLASWSQRGNSLVEYALGLYGQRYYFRCFVLLQFLLIAVFGESFSFP